MSQLDKPQQWTTGDDAPTQKQTSFIQTLAKEKGVEVEANKLNKSDASAKINELKGKSTASAHRMGTTNPGATAGEPIQDPTGWSTGDDPASSKQTGYIAVMAKEAGEAPPAENMGKTEASQKIGELKEKTGM
ncbi:hypothetical protein LTR37_019800 [Vermiconidia calcicola]|uniref:Uncharacterized protein n=1 Tax=Vermiconidia calcicola TaxID=1690605 RepID=A0ACC3MF17_9PEZI|nr:hypothetical protein LTR37_019800 [Vermiconidia calcicola]